MIPLESFKKYRKIDFVVIIVFSFLWAVFSFCTAYFFDYYWAFVLTIFLGVVLMVFTELLVRKAGAPTLFYFISSFFIVLPNFEVQGLERIIVFVVAGLLFGAFYRLIDFEIKNIPFDLIISAAVSTASIPVTSTFLLSSSFALKLPISLINLVLLAGIIGVLGASFACILWEEVKLTKWVEKFEYGY